MVSGFSAVGSAHVWGARGRWFESSNPDQNRTETACLSGFSSWSLEEGRTEVGRGFDGNFIV